MSFVLRDTQPTIVHCDEDIIRATLGIAELFLQPTVTFKACYSVASGSGSGEVAEMVYGEVEGRDVRWPFRRSDVIDWEGREFLLTHLLTELQIKTSTNISPLLFVPPYALSISEEALYTQLVFERLNVPGLSILSPALAVLLALNATTGLVLRVGRASSDVSIVTDSVVREARASVEIGQDDCEAHLEKLMMADEGLDKELKQAAGVESWVPGHKEALVKELRGVIVGDCTEDVEVPLAKTGSASAVVVAAPAAEDDAFDVAKKLAADTQPAPPKPKKASSKPAAAASANADVIAVTLPSIGKDVTVGPVRHRLFEPLLLGKTPGGDTVWEGIGRAVEHPGLSLAERVAVWDGLAVTGDLARFKSFPTALVTYLAPFLLSSPEIVSETQPARARLLSIPDYIANFKGATNEIAPFLGASMVGKMAFSDTAGKHCVTKVDYNARGPAAIYTIAAE